MCTQPTTHQLTAPSDTPGFDNTESPLTLALLTHYSYTYYGYAYYGSTDYPYAYYGSTDYGYAYYGSTDYGYAYRPERLHILEAVVVQLRGRAMLLPPLVDAL